MESKDELLKLIDQFPRDPNKQHDAIRRLEDAARSVPREAVKLWVAGVEPRATAAFVVVDGLADLSIVPLAEAELPKDPASIPRYMAMLTEPEAALRRRVAQRLEQLLDDHRPVPARRRAGPASEEREPALRVCDHAYLAIRSLANVLSADDETEAGSRHVFTGLPEAARDAEIRRAHTTGDWRHRITPGGSAEPPGHHPPKPRQ